MTPKLYNCTLLPEVTRDDPPKLGVRCNETGVKAAFWREQDRAMFIAAPDMLETVETMRAAYGRLHDMLSEMIESGRLTEADCPDDFQAIVEQLAGPCNKAWYDSEKAIAKAEGRS